MISIKGPEKETVPTYIGNPDDYPKCMLSPDLIREIGIAYHMMNGMPAGIGTKRSHFDPLIVYGSKCPRCSPLFNSIKDIPPTTAFVVKAEDMMKRF